MTEAYCEVSDCERPAFRGTLCATHLKQKQRTGKLAPVAEKLSPIERMLEEMNALVEAESDEEYNSRRRAVIALGREVGRRSVRDAIKAGLARAKAKGKRIGRPPKLSREKALAAVKREGSIKRAAARLGVTRRAVRRALREGGSKPILSIHHRSACPQEQRGSP